VAGGPYALILVLKLRKAMNQMLSDSPPANAATDPTVALDQPPPTVEPARFVKPQRVAFVQSCWHRDIVAESRIAFLAEIAARGISPAQVDLFEVPGAFEGEVTYHDSCSGLRELGIKQQPRQLLSLVPGLSLCEMEQCEQCCGFGGTFAVKYGNISAAIADDKCANIQATKARAVVLGDLGCMMQIEGRLRRQGDNTTQVLHIAEVLSGKR